MSQDELLPEELNDCQRALVSLIPRASRIDRDRLMIRLGEQSATRGSTPWKWGTAASLLLALVLGLRPALAPHTAAPAQLGIQSPSAAPRAPQPRDPRAAEPDDATPLRAVRPIADEVDWLLAVASGQFDPLRTLTVRPRLAPAGLASRAARVPALDDSPDTSPPLRGPILRWGDRPLRRDATDLAEPPTS